MTEITRIELKNSKTTLLASITATTTRAEAEAAMKGGSKE